MKLLFFSGVQLLMVALLGLIMSLAFPGEVKGQYCGDALRIDLLTGCEWESGVFGGGQCKPKYLNKYVASCTGNNSNCWSNNVLCGSDDAGRLCNGNATNCDRTIASVASNGCDKAQCWVNVNDPPPPPPPSGDCSKSCSNSSQCGSLTCAPAGVCWGDSCDTGDTAPNHRIKAKAYDCNNNAMAGVMIRAWGNTCTTGADGTCVVSKGTACSSSQLETSVVAGKDADSNQAYYFSRVGSPSFERGTCGNTNCNYTGTPLTSSPYREAYYVDMVGETVNSFTYKFCSSSDAGANYGFDFKQISGCATASRPNADFTDGPAHNSSIWYGRNYTWTNSASDSNGNMKSWGIYVRKTGDSFNTIGWSSANPTIFPNGVASATVTSDAWSCNEKNQEYEVAANAKEGASPLLECSGGATQAYSTDTTKVMTRCASGDDLRKVTCRVPSCTFTSSATSISSGSSATFAASSSYAGMIQLQYKESSATSFTNWGSATGSNPSKSLDFTCTTDRAGKTYNIKCNAWSESDASDPKCYGTNGTTDGSNYVDCGTNDYKTVSCGVGPTNTPTPTPTPSSCGTPGSQAGSKSCTAITFQWGAVTGASDYEWEVYGLSNPDADGIWGQSGAGILTGVEGDTSASVPITMPHYYHYGRVRVNSGSCTKSSNWRYVQWAPVTTCIPTGSFTQYPSATVSMQDTATMEVNCQDINSDLTSCYMVRRERPAGGNWGNWSNRINEVTHASGTNSLTTNSVDWTCFSNQAGMGHEWVVEGVDKAGNKCTGKEAKLSGWSDCGSSDRVLFTCTADPVCTGGFDLSRVA